MSEVFDYEAVYPIREYLHTPINPVEWIDEELRVGGSDAELRRSFGTQLYAIYGKSTLGESFHYHAQTLNKAHARTADALGEDYDQSSDYRGHAFLMGTLLATHSHLRSNYSHHRQEILSRWSNLPHASFDSDESKGELQRMAHVLNAVEEYPIWYEQQDEQTKDVLTTSAARLFSDFPNELSIECEYNFMFGYLFAANAIEEINDIVSTVEDDE